MANFYLKVKVFINGREVYLYIMPEWMVTTVENIQPISTAILDVIVTGYNFLRTFFFSYFVVNLLNFFTLTLMYNYLNVPTQPSFSHNFMEKLANILYLQNTLTGSLQKMLNKNFTL